MRGISRYEKFMLALTAAFVLVCGTWFFARSSQAQPYLVTTVRQESSTPVELPAEETYGQPESLLPGEKIDLNTADPRDLQRLPGIGEKRALAIAAHREEHGPFGSVEDLLAVPGIGEGILAQVQEHCTVGEVTEGAS